MSQLKTNTTDLQAILAQVNALPEAGTGGGASVETSNVTIAASAFPTVAHYSPTLGEIAMWEADGPGAEAQFECVKGTIFIVTANQLGNRTFVGCEYIAGEGVLVTEPVARIE